MRSKEPDWRAKAGTRPMLRFWLLLLLALGTARIGYAHPMGNFSINHYAGIRLEKDAVELRYIIDQAEIPTYQQIQEAGIVAQVGDPSLRPYLARQAALWKGSLLVEIDGEPVRLATVSQTVIFPPGAGGLPTMKIGVIYRGTYHPKSRDVHLRYRDDNFPGHAGWKEIVITAADGVDLGAVRPYKLDRSDELTNYPTDLLNSPPQDLEAAFTFTVPAPVVSVAAAAPVAATSSSSSKTILAPAAPPVTAKTSLPAASAATGQTQPDATATPTLVLQPNRQATPRSRFTELMASPKVGFWFLLTAALLAAGLGAMHALEPGHGKTIVAAYLVGSRGRTRHAVGLGLLVTAAHTAGVYLLGAVVLYASRYIVPERIYPWLSIVSGLIIAVLAGYLFLRAWTGVEAELDHDAGVLHSHWYSRRRTFPAADSRSASKDEEKTVSLKQLLILGITGGIVPCPAALVVLLSAVSMHRIGLGLFLIVAFSCGLAAVLVGIGILMVRARHLVSRWKSDGPWAKRWLPLVSASAMFVAGLAIAAAALPAAGLSPARFGTISLHDLGPFLAVVGLGLFLGMRHSTDPDHVVAVSTIVSRERSVGQGAVIGMMWGFGHTLTIFVVGALIILFKLTIPPRLGLSMELAVAAMLIALGILNLTGVLQGITERLTPARWAKAPVGASDAASDAAGRSRGVRGMVRRFGYYQLLRPLAIGLVHGLAGSAAVALLVLSMIRSPAWAVAYLVVFGLGTVAGMMLMTTAMAIPIALTGARSTRYLTLVSGVVSVCFGLFLVYQIGFVDGLFTRHVHWTPQ
jgi:ABC-type nickel/cobalt efflux system permease component RcnA